MYNYKPSKTQINFKNDLMEYIKKFNTTAWTDGRLFRPSDFTGLNRDGKPYHGFNQFLTSMVIKLRGFDSRIFLTGGEIERRGGTIKKGEKSCAISCPHKCFRAVDGNKIVSAKQRENMSEDEYYQSIKGFGLEPVFNLSQTTLKYEPTIFGEPRKDAVLRQDVMDIINGIPNPPQVIFAMVESPYYNPLTDQIYIPPIETFKTDAFFYAALLHEFGHALGASFRTNRKSLTETGIENYQMDELIAEMYSSIMMDLLGFEPSEYLENNNAYTKYWAKAIPTIEGIDKMISKAFAETAKSVEYSTGINIKED